MTKEGKDQGTAIVRDVLRVLLRHADAGVGGDELAKSMVSALAMAVVTIYHAEDHASVLRQVGSLLAEEADAVAALVAGHEGRN